jgi:glycosyltransferase involved in cell wall biosynthesis
VALADAIASLLTNHELRTAMGASGREFVMREHSKEKIGRHFLDLYQECLGVTGNVSGCRPQKTA